MNTISEINSCVNDVMREVGGRILANALLPYLKHKQVKIGMSPYSFSITKGKTLCKYVDVDYSWKSSGYPKITFKLEGESIKVPWHIGYESGFDFDLKSVASLLLSEIVSQFEYNLKENKK